MSYTEAWIVCDGALDVEHILPTEEEALAWLRDQISMLDAEISGQGYVLTHDHGAVDECECIQYVTDHRPAVQTEGSMA